MFISLVRLALRASPAQTLANMLIASSRPLIMIVVSLLSGETAHGDVLDNPLAMAAATSFVILASFR